MPVSDRLYHCPALDRYERESFEDEYFLFNPASGETHLLNASAMWLLEHLGAEPLSEATLKARLWEGENTEAEPELDRALRFQLKHLQTLGLVEVWDETQRSR